MQSCNNMKKEAVFIFLMRSVLMVVLVSANAYPADGNKAGTARRSISHATGAQHYSLLNINALSMWATDDGSLERRTESQSAGVTFPRGSGTCVYAGGLVWGGNVQDGTLPALRVGGQQYISGTVPGRIIVPGVAEDPDNAGVQVYRIRRDWQTADLKQDASGFFDKAVEDVTDADVAALRSRYRNDWNNWPWQKGAPYYNRDGVPGYQPNPDIAYDSTKDEPGLAGADQVLWMVCNDLNSSVTRAFSGSPPIGLELQVTCWAYSSTDELNNVIFERYRLIYKGTATTAPGSKISSMYLAKWADPNIGDLSDDYAGCAADKNIGFCYNSGSSDAVYSTYGVVPPVVGYALLQGPVVPQAGSSAHYNFTSLRNHANLPMTSFVYFSSGNVGDPPTGSYSGTQAWWRLLSGYCFTDPFSGKCTKYPLSGDPQTLQGWVDGRVEIAGDRKILLSSGPFQMALGDTQEVVVGLICALGKNNVDGVGKMEQIEGVAQDLMNFDFVPPKTVPVPHLRVVELDQKLLLDWESDTASVAGTESYNSDGYKFETYNIYQFRGPQTSDEYLLFPAFDITKPRSLQVTTDLLRNHSLVNGQKYYYAVTTVALNPDSGVSKKRIESSRAIQLAVPHSPNPGTIYPYSIGDTVSSVSNSAGSSDASVNAVYFDPSKADGHAYKVVFSRPKMSYKAKWSFVDVTAGDTLLRNMMTGAAPERITSRGFTIEVEEPKFGFRNVYQTLFGFQPAHDVVFNQPNPGEDYMVIGGGSSQLDTIVGFTTNDQDLEWRFLGDSSWAAWIGKDPSTTNFIRVPYTIWQMDRSGKPQGRQVYTFITDHAQDSVWRPTVLLDREYGGQAIRVFYPVSAYVDSARDNKVWYGARYNDSIPWAPDSFMMKAILWISAMSHRDQAELWKTYIADLDGDGIPAPKGTIIRFVQNKVIHDKDEKLVTPLALVKNDVNAARQEVKRINVFPNPYYGLNRAELSRTQRFVTFNHLPKYATIRVINLSGQVVKTIQKSDDTQFATWDLNNENGLPVASGIYLANLELKDVQGVDLGSTVLKLMIVQEQRVFQLR